MARYTQLRRRGATIQSASPPPAEPDPPELRRGANTGTGYAKVIARTAAAYPAGGASWDLFAEIDVDPPTAQVTADQGLFVDWFSGFETDATILYAFVRCWNADHTAYTDSAVASRAVEDTRPVTPATITSVDELAAGEWWVTWHTPIAMNWWNDDIDLLVEMGQDPPTIVVQASAALDTDYQTGPYFDTEIAYCAVRGWAPGGLDPHLSPTIEQVIPPV